MLKITVQLVFLITHREVAQQSIQMKQANCKSNALVVHYQTLHHSKGTSLKHCSFYWHRQLVGHFDTWAASLVCSDITLYSRCYVLLRTQLELSSWEIHLLGGYWKEPAESCTKIQRKGASTTPLVIKHCHRLSPPIKMLQLRTLNMVEQLKVAKIILD